jgi:hypothetical protein
MPKEVVVDCRGCCVESYNYQSSVCRKWRLPARQHR